MVELIKDFEIKEILPCLTTPGYIRFVAQADNELEDVIPTIFMKTPPGKANYITKDNSLTIRMENRNVTLFASGKIGVTNTPNLDAAKDFLQTKIKTIINDAYQDFLTHGTPDQKQIDAKKKNSWMELFSFLPKTNCGKCGFPICSSFAVNVFQGESRLSECELLKDPKYASKIEKMVNKLGRMFLISLGWEF
ncbi:MAG: (Fe-S)-binding protein [Promethearchaeota archaeon]